MDVRQVLHAAVVRPLEEVYPLQYQRPELRNLLVRRQVSECLHSCPHWHCYTPKLRQRCRYAINQPIAGLDVRMFGLSYALWPGTEYMQDEQLQEEVHDDALPDGVVHNSQTQFFISYAQIDVRIFV